MKTIVGNFQVKKIKLKLTTIATSLALLVNGALQAQNVKEPFEGTIGKTSADSKEWWPQNPKAPEGAPNVVWILLDDVGFGATSTFGGLIETPTFDSLAEQGIRYTNFHTCAISAPTRSALLTGRNSHSVNMGAFAHKSISFGYPGYNGRIPSSAGTIAEVLRDNGYSTFAVGKYGITPDGDATDAGPFDRWPGGKGFEHFFGFLGSQTDQYKPDLVEDFAHVTPDGRHLSEQITDKAISYISRQKKAAPDKPFFLYYAPGAVHAPHQVAKEWIDRYKGKFNNGWDVYREKVLTNQKKLGLIPADARLPDRNPNIKAWNSLTPDEKKLYAKFFEVYAGYLTYTDYEVGRLVSYLKESNQLDNTLIFVLIGDNGASKEGGFNGVYDKPSFRSTKPITERELIQYNLSKIDDIGTPDGKNTNYPLGWAQAANTPFKLWKQDAQAEGGTRNPLIVFYPKGIKDKGSIRTQYGHVIDLYPTTLEYLGIKKPEYIRGVKQDPVHGISLVYSFTNPELPSKRTLQHYYIFGNRSIYKDGWKAAASHHPDWIDQYNSVTQGKPLPSSNYDNDVWELYNLNEDFNERIDLSKRYPEKLKELKDLFEVQAHKYNLYPFIGWEDVFKNYSAPKK